MTIDYSIANAAGEVFEVGTSATALQWPVPPGGRRVLQIVDPATHYVDVSTGEVLPKQTFAATVSGTTISGLPPATTIKTDGSTFFVNDGAIEIEYDFDGTYDVVCTAPGYLPATYPVTQVTPP